jgi:hypothetical protein
MKEIWKPIKNYENYYEVSSMGRVKKVSGKMMSQHKWNGLYWSVKLMVDGIRKSFFVHRLVAQAFIENCNNFSFINHINGNKEDNNVCNLEWCTHACNMGHSYYILEDKLSKSPEFIEKKFKNKPLKCIELNKVFSSSCEASFFINASEFNNTKNQQTIGRTIRRSIDKKTKAYNFHWEHVVL